LPENENRESPPHKTFEQLARELEADEDEARFEDQVRRIAKAPAAKAPAAKPDNED